MSKTVAPHPTDRRMWRRLLRLAHPDGAGEHLLFIWVQSVREYVLDDMPEEPPPRVHRQPPKHHPKTAAGDRVDFEVAYEKADSFHHLTRLAVAMADEVPEPHSGLLRMLSDCYTAAPTDVALSRQESQGCTYRTLAAIAYAAGLSTSERQQWYRVAESVPLAQRHGGHILSKLKGS